MHEKDRHSKYPALAMLKGFTHLSTLTLFVMLTAPNKRVSRTSIQPRCGSSPCCEHGHQGADVLPQPESREFYTAE